MVTAFPQLHENVEKSHFISFTGTVYQVDVLHQDFSVPMVRRTGRGEQDGLRAVEFMRLASKMQRLSNGNTSWSSLFDSGMRLVS